MLTTLFRKIFVWFWLAMGLVGVVLTAMDVFAPWGEGSPKVRHLVRNALIHHGEELVWQFHTGGREAAVQSMRQWERQTGMRVYFFQDSTLVASPAAPSPRVWKVAQTASYVGRPASEVIDETVCYAEPLPVIGSQRYVIAGVLHRIPCLDEYVSPVIVARRIPVILVVTGFVCYFLALQLTGPLRKIGNAARSLAEGNLSVRVAPALGNRKDELVTLAADFDRMAARVQSLVESQQNLLRDISHEIRSPLARLSLAVGIASHGDEQDRAFALDRLEHEVERLDELIGQILVFNRLEAAPKKAEVQPLGLLALVQGVADDVGFEARSRDRALRVWGSEELVVNACGEHLRRAVENVLRNAVRYAPEGTEVEVRLEPAGSGGIARLTVRDRGPGVPEDCLPRIFEPFYRLTPEGESPNGTGLGLAIAKRSVELYGGTIRAQNAPGGGLVVRIDLPLAV